MVYTLLIAVGEPGRARALSRMVAASPAYALCDVAVLEQGDDLAARLDAGAVPDILFVDTVLSPDDAAPTAVDLVAGRLSAGTAPTQVVYATVRPEHVTYACRTNPVYILLGEPGAAVAQRDVDEALARALGNLRAASRRPLSVRCDGRLRVVPPDRITYVESDRRKCHIHAGDEVLTTYATLDALARELPSSFVRSHKSFLVNMRFIDSIEPACVRLSTGEAVPVSQKRRRYTHETFAAYVAGRI